MGNVEDDQANAGVGGDDSSNIEMVDEEIDVGTPKELKIKSWTNLGQYWNNSTVTTVGEQYVTTAIEAYGTSHALRSTPQYGFNHGMKELGDGKYEAT